MYTKLIMFGFICCVFRLSMKNAILWLSLCYVCLMVCRTKSANPHNAEIEDNDFAEFEDFEGLTSFMFSCVKRWLIYISSMIIAYRHIFIYKILITRHLKFKISRR